MIFIALLLAVVAFIETIVFFYLKTRFQKLGTIRMALRLRDDDTTALFQEADHKYQEAQVMYDEANRLVVQANAG